MFDDMHKSMIRWLIVAAKLSDGEVAFITGVNRRKIQSIRNEMQLDANHSPAKRAKLVTRYLEIK